MEEIKLRPILASFTSNDIESLYYPFLSRNDFRGKKWVAATDCHVMICVPQDMAPWVDEIPKSPEITSIIDVEKCGGEFSIDEILEAISTIPFVEYNDKEDCPDCDGAGEFSHGRHTYECKNCDINGKSESLTTKKERDRCIPVLWKHGLFNASILEFVMQNANEFGAAELIQTSPSKATIFQAGEAIFVVMPVMQSDEALSKAIVIP